VKERYSLEGMLDRIEQLYEVLLANRHREVYQRSGHESK